MKESGKPQALQASVVAVIEDLRLDAQNAQAQSQIIQSVYNDLV